MKGLLDRLRDVMDSRDPAEVAALRADLRGLPVSSPPADARAAEIHEVVAAAFRDVRQHFELALDHLGEPGYLELAEKSLLHAEEMVAQLRLLLQRAVDYGEG